MEWLIPYKIDDETDLHIDCSERSDRRYRWRALWTYIGPSIVAQSPLPSPLPALAAVG